MASALGLTHVVRATADNPAVDIDAPRRTLDVLRRTGADYVIDFGLPFGAAVEALAVDGAFARRTLATEPYDREHVTPFIKRDPRARALDLLAPSALRRAELRFSVDTPEDLDYMRRLHAEVGPTSTPAPLEAFIVAADRLLMKARPHGREPMSDEATARAPPRRHLVLAYRAGGDCAGHVRDLARRRPPPILVQPAAALVVFGGTLAAVVFSFPIRLLARTWRALGAAFGGGRQADGVLLARIGEYAARARQRGTMSLEGELAGTDDPFLSRAIALVVDGVSAADVRHTLKTFSQAREEADTECAHVLEAAAGYAPTLGILGAVLGLIQAMANLAEPASRPRDRGRLRGNGVRRRIRQSDLPAPRDPIAGLVSRRGVGREVIIEGAVAIQQGIHPRLVEGHLRSLLSAWGTDAIAPSLVAGSPKMVGR